VETIIYYRNTSEGLHRIAMGTTALEPLEPQHQEHAQQHAGPRVLVVVVHPGLWGLGQESTVTACLQYACKDTWPSDLTAYCRSRFTVPLTATVQLNAA
jgi:hypothetical protein